MTPLLSGAPPPEADRGQPHRRISTVLAFALAAGPTLVAIWTVPWFVTQDGPAHLYNAHIIAESWRPASPFRDAYRVRWEPLPNWAGHLTLMGLLAVLPSRQADRAILSITLVGLAASIVWLRNRVAGPRGLPTAAVLAVLLALNVAWLFGFTSFLLGACLFPITLGVWWPGRDRLGFGRSSAVSGLLVLGYFCHLVSLGLTAFGLVVLAAVTPGPALIRRWTWTAVSLAVPLIPLGVLYRGLMRAGGPIDPRWGHLDNPLSPASWGSQIGWVDPISLGSKAILPFFEVRSRWCGLLAPVFWFAIALMVLLIATRRSWAGRSDPRRGWALLAALLLLGGLIGPDTLGPDHGNYLPQRVALLGLVALVPCLDLGGRMRIGRTALAGAVALQSAYVWDYAIRTDRSAGLVAAAGPIVGRGQRVGTLLVDIRGVYRANPLLHVDCALGIGTGNVLWSNYEAGHYYFPVGLAHPDRQPRPEPFEAVAMLDAPEDRARRAGLWGDLLDRSGPQFDRLLVWGSDPLLDALNARSFEPIRAVGPVRIYRRRNANPPSDRAGLPRAPGAGKIGGWAEARRPAGSEPP